MLLAFYDHVAIPKLAQNGCVKISNTKPILILSVDECSHFMMKTGEEYAHTQKKEAAAQV